MTERTSSPVKVGFFNNKGGVGKTTLVYHLAWMFQDLGLRVLTADLDPQANLTAAFLDEERVVGLWGERGRDSTPRTVYEAIQPLLKGTGDIQPVELQRVEEMLAVLPGDLTLSRFEDDLSNQWAPCLDGKERAFRVISAFWRLMEGAASSFEADVVLVDLGPNLGAINRAALIAVDHVVVPLAPDLFSLQGMENLGPTLREWRKGWEERLEHRPEADLPLPSGQMRPAGYVVLQHAVRMDRPVKAYQKWIARIPETYHRAVLGERAYANGTVDSDPHCLALLKHYHSLVPLSQEARKPLFHLKPADGAIGAHVQAVEHARQHFKDLASKLADRVGLAERLREVA